MKRARPEADRPKTTTSTEGEKKPDPIPELVTGRGQRRGYALERLKNSWVLRATMVVAFLCYGAVGALVIAGDHPWESSIQIGVVVLLSLASWNLLFWWYPVLERTAAFLGNDDRGRIIALTLENLAITCVVVVHVLMVFIILHMAGVT